MLAAHGSRPSASGCRLAQSRRSGSFDSGCSELRSLSCSSRLFIVSVCRRASLPSLRDQTFLHDRLQGLPETRGVDVDAAHRVDAYDPELELIVRQCLSAEEFADLQNPIVKIIWLLEDRCRKLFGQPRCPSTWGLANFLYLFFSPKMAPYTSSSPQGLPLVEVPLRIAKRQSCTSPRAASERS